MKILAIGCHPDDIVLGCGATLSKYKNRGDDICCLVLTHGESSGSAKQRTKEEQECMKVLGIKKLIIMGLPDASVKDDKTTIDVIERVIDDFKPDIIFTHNTKDRHQDHRNVARATLSAARRVPQIFMHECSSTMQNFSPQLFEDVTDFMELKLKALKKHKSQLKKDNPLIEATEGLAKFRAFQGNVQGKGNIRNYAEAFEIARITR